MLSPVKLGGRRGDLREEPVTGEVGRRQRLRRGVAREREQQCDREQQGDDGVDRMTSHRSPAPRTSRGVTGATSPTIRRGRRAAALSYFDRALRRSRELLARPSSRGCNALGVPGGRALRRRALTHGRRRTAGARVGNLAGTERWWRAGGPVGLDRDRRDEQDGQDEADHADQAARGGERGQLVHRGAVIEAHQEQQQGRPHEPVDGARQRAHHQQHHPGGDAERPVRPRRQRVGDAAAVELADREQVQRGDEAAHPGRVGHRMGHDRHARPPRRSAGGRRSA